MTKQYPIIGDIGYKFPKLHRCDHESYSPIDISHRLHPVWKEFFTQNDLAINEILRWSYVEAYNKGYDVRPNPQDVLNVFSMSPDAIRVVLVGQDPYPQEGVANGFAFATNQSTITSSLERLFSCIGGIRHKEDDYTLSGWIRQGVFLLNKTPVLWVPIRTKEKSVIDVDPKDIDQLTAKWNGVIRTVCLFIAGYGDKKTDFVLFGEKAKSLKTDLPKAILCGHPSGRNTGNAFDGKCFELLPHIEWRDA